MVLLPLAAALCFLLTATDSLGQRVLKRQRLTNYIEDLTFIPNGPFANHIAMTTGYEVYGVPGTANSNAAIKKLFDLRELPIVAAPHGMAYIDSESAFAFLDVFQPETLILSDHRGKSLGTRAIRYLDGYFPDQVDGIGYIPTHSPVFPDHLVFIALSYADLSGRLQVMRRDGQVVAEIILPEPAHHDFPLGVAYVSSGRLAVTGYISGSIYIIDFAGNLLAGPVGTGHPGSSLEGIVELPDERVVVSSRGQLLYFDRNLQRLPDRDRDARFGTELIQLLGLTWNTDTQEHLIHAIDESSGRRAIYAISPSLDTVREQINIEALGADIAARSFDLSYVPEEHLIGVLHRRSPRGILLLDNSGTWLETVLTPPGTPLGLTYIPGHRQFAYATFTTPWKLTLVTRTGSLIRQIDFAPAGILQAGAAAYFNPAHPTGGQFLVFDENPLGSGLAVVSDFNGQVIRSFGYREALGVLVPVGVTAITTGSDAGAFSVIDADNHEIVVFRLE